ncbi:uncharacterized protein [Euphorbia lathyris]|uniref:uncharacterized protein isoform X3 n=1 Tax=Euphorbia lathyris TaxID=212925 RepID=UPI0033137862
MSGQVNESGCGILQQDIPHLVNKFTQPKTGSCLNNGGADCRFVKSLGVQEEEKQSPVKSNWLVYSNRLRCYEEAFGRCHCTVEFSALEAKDSIKISQVETYKHLTEVKIEQTIE